LLSGYASGQIGAIARNRFCNPQGPAGECGGQGVRKMSWVPTAVARERADYRSRLQPVMCLKQIFET
jgi:hypothetical protein